jgi:hypothetical protein
MTLDETREMLEAAAPHLNQLEQSVGEDGVLSFEAVLPDGRFIMCERSPQGSLNTGVYEGPDGRLLEFLGNANPERLQKLLRGEKTGHRT